MPCGARVKFLLELLNQPDHGVIVAVTEFVPLPTEYHGDADQNEDADQNVTTDEATVSPRSMTEEEL